MRAFWLSNPKLPRIFKPTKFYALEVVAMVLPR